MKNKIRFEVRQPSETVWMNRRLVLGFDGIINFCSDETVEKLSCALGCSTLWRKTRSLGRFVHH